MNVFQPGALVFDIGAHHGESADKFLTHYGAGKVISVEASRSNFAEVVKHWTDKMNEPRVIPIHAAVAEFPGQLVQVFRCDDQTGLTTLDPDSWAKLYPDKRFTFEEWVPTINLDEMIRRFGLPAYIKVDVEGLEFEVLHGLSQKVPALSFEFHGEHMERTRLNLLWLEQLGFSLAGYVTEDVDLDNFPTRPLREVLQELLSARPQWGNITVA